MEDEPVAHKGDEHTSRGPVGVEAHRIIVLLFIYNFFKLRILDWCNAPEVTVKYKYSYIVLFTVL